MTGDHKNLVALFGVHKLVELALARNAAAEDTEEREFDERVDEEAALAWAKAYAIANLAGVMEREGDKARDGHEVLQAARLARVRACHPG